MPARRTHLAPHLHPHLSRGELEAALLALRTRNDIPTTFPRDVLTEAVAATAPSPSLDLRDIPFVTLDPADSRDLDQAFHLERTHTGFILRYAISDLPSFVTPGGALDAEARKRGQTLYLPDGAVPLHPRVLSEDRASLLPGVDRTAFVWTIHLDSRCVAPFELSEPSPAEQQPSAEKRTEPQPQALRSLPKPRVERALIRSREKLDYESAQRSLDRSSDTVPGANGVHGAHGAHEGYGTHEAHEQLLLLREFGELRIAEERRRGGASLNMADEEIVSDNTGYRIKRSFPLRVEEWNSQLSLLTGMVAARIMLDGGIGVIRTMPPPDEAALAEFRARVTALGQHWQSGMPYGEYLRTIHRDTATGVAVLHAASSLFRGADYAVFGVPGAEGEAIRPPENPAQAAIAAPYAHVTAPLRRLVDRWGLVICEALCAGEPVPAWALKSLADLPATMRASASFAGRVAAEALDRVEAALLRDQVGETFDAVVLDSRGNGARVQIEEPPVTARSNGSSFAPGTQARVRVVKADVASGEIVLEAA